MIPTPIDQLPGISEEDRKRLILWRESDDTRWVLGILAQFKPVSSITNPDAVTAEGVALRLGAREGYDALYSQLFLIGQSLAAPAPKPVRRYGQQPRKNEAAK